MPVPRRSERAGGIAMKTSLTVLVLVLLLLSILAGCAPGPNPSRKMASEHGEFAGFWLGLWQGFIAPFVFVASLFKGDLNVYEVHNNGSMVQLRLSIRPGLFLRRGRQPDITAVW